MIECNNPVILCDPSLNLLLHDNQSMHVWEEAITSDDVTGETAKMNPS